MLFPRNAPCLRATSSLFTEGRKKVKGMIGRPHPTREEYGTRFFLDPFKKILGFLDLGILMGWFGWVIFLSGMVIF